MNVDPEEIRSLKGLPLHDPVLPVEDEFDGADSTLTRAEVRSPLLNCAHAAIISVSILIASASGNIASQGTLTSTANILDRAIKVFTVTPTLWASPESVFPVLILFLLCVGGFAIVHGSIALRSGCGWSLSPSLVKFWIIAQRLFLPLPALALGSNLGFGIYRLTTDLDSVRELLVTILCLVLWIWATVSSITVYNSTGNIRSSDSVQLHHEFIGFGLFLHFLPVIYTVLPWGLHICLPLVGYHQIALRLS
jgi:hypothetical protein